MSMPRDSVLRTAGLPKFGLASVGLNDNFKMSVLGADEVTMSCSLLEQIGRRLIIQVSVPLAADACFRIECGDAVLLGELRALWRDGSSMIAVIEVQQTLLPRHN